MKEADLQRAVSDYLQYKMNAGDLYFDRLNSGSVLVKRGVKTYRVELCREGTADFMVVRKDIIPAYPTHIAVEAPQVIFLELKGEKGKQLPEQGAFQKLVEAQGASYFIIRSIEELEEVLDE